MERAYHQTLASVNAIAEGNGFHPYTVVKVMRDSGQCVAITEAQFRHMRREYYRTLEGRTQPAAAAVRCEPSPAGDRQDDGATGDDLDFERLMDADDEEAPVESADGPAPSPTVVGGMGLRRSTVAVYDPTHQTGKTIRVSRLANPERIRHARHPVKRRVQQSGSYERVPEDHELIEAFKRYLLTERVCNSSSSVSQFMSTIQRWLCSVNKLARDQPGSRCADLDIYGVHWNVIGELSHTQQHLAYLREECGMVEGTLRKYLNHLGHFCTFIERRYHERAGQPVPLQRVTARILRQEFVVPETVKIQRDEVSRQRRNRHRQRVERHGREPGAKPAYHHHLELALILTEHPEIVSKVEELLQKPLDQFTVDDEYFVRRHCMTTLTYRNGLRPGVVANLNVGEWKERTGTSDRCGWILNFHCHKNSKNGSVATAYLSKQDARLWEKYDQLVSARRKGFKDRTIHFDQKSGRSSGRPMEDYNKPFFVTSRGIRTGMNVETNDIYNMSIWLNKTLGHTENSPYAIPKLKASHLRKALATAAKDFDGINIAEARLVAELMGHTEHTAAEYYHQNDLSSTETAAHTMESIYRQVLETVQFPERAAPDDESGPAEQAADEQAVDEQAADGQAADEQAVDEQAADKQAADEQAADEQQAPMAEEVPVVQEQEPVAPPSPVPSQSEGATVIKEKAVEDILGGPVTTSTKLTQSQVEQSGKVPAGFTAKQIASAAQYMVKKVRIAEITQLFEHDCVAGRIISSQAKLKEALAELSSHKVLKPRHHLWMSKNKNLSKQVLMRLQMK